MYTLPAGTVSTLLRRGRLYSPQSSSISSSLSWLRVASSTILRRRALEATLELGHILVSPLRALQKSHKCWHRPALELKYFLVKFRVQLVEAHKLKRGPSGSEEHIVLSRSPHPMG